MKEKYVQIYNWYNSGTGSGVRYAVATCIVGFSLLISLPFLTIILGLTPYQSPFLIMKAEAIGIELISGLYFAIPYIMIVLLFTILLLYRNIILKIAMVGLFLCSLIYQMGMLMGFSSYVHFLIFLPQIVLVIAGIIAMYRTYLWRTA